MTAPDAPSPTRQALLSLPPHRALRPVALGLPGGLQAPVRVNLAHSGVTRGRGATRFRRDEA